MIVDRILEAKKLNIKQFPVHSNRASELGHPCERYHVYNRTRWEEKALPDINLQLIFDLGREIEEITTKDLREAGFEVIEQQRPFVWREFTITGMIDGKILLNGEAVPFEVKSCSPYVFNQINNIQDLKNGKYPYLRKYPAQLCLYLLMDNKPRGVFLFKNKQTGAYKEIWMDIDWDLGDVLLKRAEAVNKHVAAGTLPEPINEDMWCDDCGFAHICLPEKIGKEVEIDTSELADILDRMEVLKEAKKEYEELDEQVKKMVEGREKILAGNWLITGAYQTRKGYTIPEKTYWVKKIRKVG